MNLTAVGYESWDNCFYNDDLVGYDESEELKFEDCVNMCRNNPKCTHFDFDIINLMCSMMKGEPSIKRTHSNYKCGIVHRVILFMSYVQNFILKF